MARLAFVSISSLLYFFFFNDTATTEIYTLSLHDALPISFRSLAAGLVVGAAAVALPSLLARGKDATGARFAVGAAVGISGFGGFFARKPRPLEANGRADASLRETWKKKLQAVRTENAKRLRSIRLVVRARPATIAERGSP